MIKATQSAAIGLLVGFALVWWVRPDAQAGAIFIVVVATLIGVALGALISWLQGLRKTSDAGRETGGKP